MENSSLSHGISFVTTFSVGSERGPDLYGSSPWYFYVDDLVLNFAFYLWRLSLSPHWASLIFLTVKDWDSHFHVEPSSPSTVLSLRLAPHCIYGFAFSVYDHIKNVSNSTARRL